MPCPPAPNYIRDKGVSDCQYLQLSPFQRERLAAKHAETSRPFKNLLSNNPEGYYMVVGGIPMSYEPTPPRVYGRHALGRSVLPMDTAQSWNRSTGIQPTSSGIYSGVGGTSSPEFIKDLWTAQVLTYWLSDGEAYADYGQSGRVTQSGHNPANPAPLQISVENGVSLYALLDIRDILNPPGDRSVTFVKGPDGMFGPSAESILVEYIRSGTAMGRAIPPQLTGSFDRLTSKDNGISTPKIAAAHREKEAAEDLGETLVPVREPAPTPCNMLAPEARAARSDCPSPDNGRTPGVDIPDVPDAPVDGGEKFAGTDTSPLLLWGLGLVAVGVSYSIYKKRQQRGL